VYTLIILDLRQIIGKIWWHRPFKSQSRRWLIWVRPVGTHERFEWFVSILNKELVWFGLVWFANQSINCYRCEVAPTRMILLLWRLVIGLVWFGLLFNQSTVTDVTLPPHAWYFCCGGLSLVWFGLLINQSTVTDMTLLPHAWYFCSGGLSLVWFGLLINQSTVTDVKLNHVRGGGCVSIRNMAQSSDAGNTGKQKPVFLVSTIRLILRHSSIILQPQCRFCK